MPDDLLRFVSGPPTYSSLWLWLGLGLLALVIAWYVLVVVATLPSDALRNLPGAEGVHERLLRHRFARTAHTITEEHRSGELSAEQASASLSATLRSFLHQATGVRAQYMQVRSIADSELATAAPLLEALGAAAFDRTSDADVAALGEQTEELIRSWS